jgi:putative membrane protein insertion efficiency factor
LAAHALSSAGLPSVVVRRLLLGSIRLYQLTLSPWLGRTCRYEPTCSAYAMEAIETHGARRGVWLAVKRIGRCHPWGGAGYDPVPRPDGRSS